jgi:mannose-6-phosphate isomerase-like protein (cupin superfamily)
MAKSEPRDIRRIVAANDPDDNAVVFSDGTNIDVRTDPARPGFASNRIWVTEGTPAPVAGVKETLHLPHTLEPPVGGSVCRFLTIPPDDWYMADLTDEKVSDFFDAMGSPGASKLGTDAPHPYMQQTRTLDYVLVMSGEVTLVLDTEEVHLKRGDTVVQIGGSHAWSNRSDAPCELFVSMHDGKP